MISFFHSFLGKERFSEVWLSNEVVKQLKEQKNFEPAGRRNVIKVEIDGNFFHIKEYPGNSFLL